MTHEELVALIRGGVPGAGGTWADFGAGGGNFTRALRELLGQNATIYAVDRDPRALHRQQPDVNTITADFTQPIPHLPPLDGLLVANALHFVRDQQRAVERLASYLHPGGTFIVVEYDVRLPRGYIPFPLPPARFEQIAHQAGLTDIRHVGARTSPTNGTTMVALAARQSG